MLTVDNAKHFIGIISFVPHTSMKQSFRKFWQQIIENPDFIGLNYIKKILSFNDNIRGRAVPEPVNLVVE